MEEGEVDEEGEATATTLTSLLLSPSSSASSPSSSSTETTPAGRDHQSGLKTCPEEAEPLDCGGGGEEEASVPGRW